MIIVGVLALILGFVSGYLTRRSLILDIHKDAAQPAQSQQGLPDAAQRDSQVGVVFGAFLTHAFKILISILWHTSG